MIRALLALLAVLVAVLAFVLDRGWLYGAAAATLVGTLAYLGRDFWTAYRRDRAASPDAAAADDSLEDLGIMDVRPREASADEASEAEAPPQNGAEAASSTAAREASTAATAGDEETGDWPENSLTGEEETADEDGAADRRYSEDRPVLGPYLESLRAALGAESVGLFVQEEVALEYRVEALASAQSDVQFDGTFETREPLLSAAMSRQPVTVHSIDPSRRQDLGYYATAPEITQMALAPIDRPNSSATVFLLADAGGDVDLGTSQARSLLERYAETGAALLEAESSTVDEGAATDQLQSFVDAGHEAAAATEADEAPAAENETSTEPRPRREIIAEEMRAADAAAEALALVLVHLNRAESIARRGEEAVASAERHLRSRLEDLAPGQRVERFGELTYGLFVRSGVDEVESWAGDLQAAMARETGELEGGVSVGVAVRREGHDAESLRADATDALLEAYETGTCTIIA
jgi:hypothetical protein